MTMQETIKIITMLSAYYGQGKADAKTMANAWHLILKDYDYDLAEKAVIEFAKTDKRDYASFPAPSKIIEQIEKQLAKYNLILNYAFNKKAYRELPIGCHECISQDKYKELLLMDSEQLQKDRASLIHGIRLLEKG